MPCDQQLADRVRDWIRTRTGFEEKRLFGGIGFLLYGNLCAAVWQNALILRIGKDAWKSYLDQDHTTEFDLTGRSMTGWVMVEPDGLESREQLDAHLTAAYAFTRTLPPKS